MLNSRSFASEGVLSVRQQAYRSLVLKLLGNLSKGQVTITERFGEQMEFGDPSAEQRAIIDILDADFYERVVKGGSIGGAEAYMDGLWDSPNLTQVTRIMAENLDTLDAVDKNVGWIQKAGLRVAHWLNRNSLTQSKQNIEAHYDLGNDLYTLFLDENMLYSSGIYNSENDSLASAQINKMERLCQQLRLTKDDHVLEIGTGWGGMAIYMASRYGCQVTTTTISEEQHAYARDQIIQAGLEDKITLLKEDYRMLDGQYDKVVSIEMIEAVGKQYLPSYVEKCYSLLKPGGLLAIQAITIADQRFEQYSKQVDFIQKYIFPGGFLPSVTHLLEQTTRHSGFVVRDLYDIGQDYARTLSDWHHAFNQAYPQVIQLGYDERFVRMWRYYLSYCEGGFLANTISTVHLTFYKVS
ncbi:putative Cyclopropane fatty acid synthase and related methyltransferase [Vibrio nigripulchritudo SOn1]|uniref:Cyclopropane fatty acid synthase and related methyltransferase n=1 Tax=Vibrio nigripulchritudo SOn1 TaxID=1238450 RepID=A0AAV2VW29_9VIBR|nr:cyclopropane-fatty-acyl-phospholipid synthase family protein [Vibrio nigripulchritudo]CCO48688.1 putative Cyclopropane fatty acid synthase and related methyltransferase [Vibrio nigripulchritudo SOn1]